MFLRPISYTVEIEYSQGMKMKRRNMEVIMAVVLLLCVALVSSRPERFLATMQKQDSKYTVIIDAGHGGNDPGKVGVNHALEKDINLKIATILRKYLVAQDVRVIMTRESDMGLYQESAKNKKVQDMKNRCALIENEKPSLAVSIHQNSYNEEYVHGAQIFYYTHSETGKVLAELIQKQINSSIDPNSTRFAKANDSYYLLKKTTVPTVIVECGFLSNYEEAAKLVEESYQEKMAWAIHLAVLQYLNCHAKEAK